MKIIDNHEEDIISVIESKDKGITENKKKCIYLLTSELEESIIMSIVDSISSITGIQDTNLEGQVRALVSNPEFTSEDLHNLWLEGKIEEGYTLGEYSKESKTHPLIKPYHKLSKNILDKDKIVDSIVGSFV